MSELHEKILDGVKHAHGAWRLQARFQHLRINSLTAIGTAGCLFGPPLAPLIHKAPPLASAKGMHKVMRDAVAAGVSDCFARWQDAVTVPGLPWYPPFASWPGPKAPPTPNVAMPLIACASAHASSITVAKKLEAAIVDELSSDDEDENLAALASAVATPLALAFTVWLASQQVTNVLGLGPVPSYAPPVVRSGPVVMGHILSVPGHLAT